MNWYALDIHTPAETRDSIAAWLVERTGQAVEERPDGTLVSFANDVSSADQLLTDLCQTHGSAVSGRVRELPAVDWARAWRDGIGPRRIERITVIPSWLRYDASEDEHVIVLDPETAFGTGEHGSTRVALRLIERVLTPGDFVLDFGSGSGILSIAAAKLGAGRAIGIEQDDGAIEVAERNAERNAVSDRVHFFIGDAGQLGPLFAPADLIASNILRIVNVALLPEVWRTLRPGGQAVFSGMEAAERDEFLAALTRAGFTPGDEVVDAGWWGVAATRP